MAIFMVRTMKRIIFHEARAYSKHVFEIKMRAA